MMATIIVLSLGYCCHRCRRGGLELEVDITDEQMGADGSLSRTTSEFKLQMAKSGAASPSVVPVAAVVHVNVCIAGPGDTSTVVKINLRRTGALNHKYVRSKLGTCDSPLSSAYRTCY